MSVQSSIIRKAAIGAALISSTVLGGAIGASVIGAASAQTSPTTATTDTTVATDSPATTDADGAPDHDSSMGGHLGGHMGGHEANGVSETLLTGDDAAKATAAAEAAVPGGTVERVETDAEGDAYEAHMTDADGNRVTVKLDSSFELVTVDEGR